ncbi:MAG: hypothetical protein JSU85_09365 [Candidatus Zixiibacteriota bacterium]|nr:MAG: hypothetical protein JSU85_09365 [candidate division Zixibacteria bacterium]
MIKYLTILLILPALAFGQHQAFSGTTSKDSIGVYIGSAWEYIFPSWLRPGDNITFVRDNDTLYISGTEESVDTFYFEFGDVFSSAGWLISGDTVKIDTLAPDSSLIITWNFINDSAGVAALGFVAGAHTVLDDTLLGINEAAAIYETITNVGKAMDDTTNYQTAYTHSQITTGNPHSIDFSDLGGSATDGQIPNDITVDHAAHADSADTAGYASEVDSGFVAGVARDSNFVEKDSAYSIKTSPAPSDNDVLKIDTDTDPDSLYFAALNEWNWSDSSSYGPDSVLFADSSNHADAADSAGKALQDASGNVITSTYGVVAGETWTGTHDFSGASLELPNGANPTVDALGEIAQESDDNNLRIYDGSTNRAIPTIHHFDACIYLPDSVNAYDSPVPLLTVDTLWAPFGIKILALTMATDVSTTDTVAFWEYADPSDGSPSLIDTVIVAAGYEQKETSITDSDIAANSYIYLDLSSATALDWIKVAGAYYIKTGD